MSASRPASRSPDVDVFVSKRFEKAYQRANAPLQVHIDGCVGDLLNRLHGDRRTALHAYDRLAHLPEPVLELDVSGSRRMLAKVEGAKVTLLSVGGKDIVPRYSESMLATDMRTSRLASELWPTKHLATLFIPRPDRTLSILHPEEISEEWLYFLDREQSRAMEDIFSGVAESLDGDHDPRRHIILGGPGTGKSCILLNLLKHFLDLNIDAKIALSDSLAAFYEMAFQMPIKDYVHRSGVYSNSDCDVLLVDDPPLIEDIGELLDLDGVRAVITAFDPLQMFDDPTDTQLDEFKGRHRVEVHSLSVCYRQKENVGKTALQVMKTVASSTPFLADDKIIRFRRERKSLTALSNDLKFSMPHGYSQIYARGTWKDIENELGRIQNARWAFWEHSPSILVVLFGGKAFGPVRGRIMARFGKDHVRIVGERQLEQVKGLEFQHVLVFMPPQLYEQLTNGFRGSGQRVYHERRLYRIPFSRAKDSVVVFVSDADLEPPRK